MKRGTSALAVAAVAVTLAVPTSGGAATTAAPADVIVSARDASALPAGARFVAELAPGLRTYLLRVPDGKTASAYSRDLRADPDIFAAQPNVVLQRGKLASSCADPPSVNAAQSLAAAVSAVTVAGGPAAPVAVLDTGIDPATAELRGRVLPGFNSVNGSTDTSDIDGHGTEVASVVAAAPGRFQGVSPSTQVMPIKIYNHNSATTVDWVVKGIEAAMNRRVPIINLSSSNPAADVPQEDSEVLQQAILAAFAKGTITIVSAGNEGKADQTVPGKLERVITVGSATAEGTRDAFSNFGSSIDVVSPGANLILPAPPSICPTGYGVANGTSFSAPAVAGAASIIKGRRPKLDTQQLYDLVRMFAAKELYEPGRDNDSGFGLLSVEEGVNAKTPARQHNEIDDDIFWVKQDLKRHKTYLRSKKRRSQTYKKTTTLQAGKDPADVYKVKLSKGWLIRGSAKTKQTSGLLDIGIWSRKAGSFDITKNRTDNLLKDSEGVTDTPNVAYRVKSSGTYYVSVEVPDAPDTADEKSAATKVDPLTTYSLTLKKSPPKKKKREEVDEEEAVARKPSAAQPPREPPTSE